MNGWPQQEPEAPAATSEMPTDGAQTGVVRERPIPDPARAALVGQWQSRVLKAKKHWEPTFRLMKWGQKFVKGIQWLGQGENDDRYVANIVQRHVNQRTAALYAKNPRFFYKRRRTLDFAVWDGTQQSLQEAMQALQVAAAASQAGDPTVAMQAQAQMAPAMELL